MALIKCKGCGQMVSDRAEKCPKCGYPVRLSMEQQEETEQSVKTHFTTETEKKETINDNPQPRQKSSKKGLLIAAVVAVIIGCGVLFAIFSSDSNPIIQQTRDIPSVETELQNVQTVQEAKQLIEGTVWEHTVNTDESELGYWVKVEFANGRYKTFYMNPSDDDWSNGGEGTYEIKEGKFANTGEKYIAVYWEGGGYLGWPTKYALVLNNFQITVQSALPDLDALFSYEPQPTSNGFMKLVEVFEVENELEEPQLPSDTLAVAVEDTPNDFSTEITKDGIANIRLGKSFNDYNTSLMNQEDIDKQCFDFSIVDIQERSEFEEVYYTMNMKLYKGQKLLCTLFGGYYYDERPNTLQATVKSIIVYSPQFKLPNGIHAGMDAKDLLDNYNATIQLSEAEGGESIAAITFEIPNITGFVFIADPEPILNRYGEEYFSFYDSQGQYKEDFKETLEKDIAELSTLKCIVIGDTYDLATVFSK